jgi:outer membrane biosynthesis protein TonB
MSTLPKFGFALIVGTWMIPGTSLASPAQAFLQQTTTTAPATADKQPEPPAKPHQPRPNPDADGKYHVGDGVTAPKLILSVEPEYSEKMRKKKINGSCLIFITIDIDGKVNDAHLLTSTPDVSDNKLHDAVMDMQSNCTKAAKQYRFEPATYQGKPVPVELKIEINFQIF